MGQMGEKEYNRRAIRHCADGLPVKFHLLSGIIRNATLYKHF